MSAEFWAIIGVGVALGGMLFRQSIEIGRIHRDVADLRERLARIEGWIAGRFREEAPP